MVSHTLEAGVKIANLRYLTQMCSVCSLAPVMAANVEGRAAVFWKSITIDNCLRHR